LVGEARYWELEDMELVSVIIALFSLLMLVWALTKISDLAGKVADMKSKIDVVSAPAETLTAVTTTLQQNIGGLHDSISRMNQSITAIGSQATKIETLGKKYEDTEALTRRIYNIMIGSYEKGRSGENYLRNTMNELMKMGLVRANPPIAGKVVEYCVVFTDGKLLAIDSKVVATRQLEALFDENKSEGDRAKLRDEIRGRLRKKVEEVSQYIDPQTTLPYAIMAVPDSIVELTSEIMPEAVRRNVMVVGYSAVPQLIVYFVRIHSFYSIEEDVAELKDRVIAVQRELSELDDRFFANRFEKPMMMLTNAVLKVRQVIGGVSSIVRLEYKEPSELPEETQKKH